MNPAHAFQGERRNVAILATSQALFLITAITVMTLSGLVGQQLTPDPALATLPVAMMSLGSLVGTLPASLFMKRFGRRTGFLTGAGFGVAGGALSVQAIGTASFWLFCAASLLHQLGWALLNLGVLPFVLLTAWVVYRMRPPYTRFTPEGERES